MTRKEAIAQGSKTYEGKPHSCGKTLKYVIGYGCVSCLCERGLPKLQDTNLMAPYRTKEKQKKKLKTWRQNNPDMVLEQRKRSNPKTKIRYQKRKTIIKDQYLKRKYKISLFEFDQILEKQSGKCAICQIDKRKTGKQFAVDHNHITGRIRGLLCAGCNRSLGFMNTPEILERAKEYLLEDVNANI